MKFGSHLFGTDTPNSDLDFKGIYLPTAREICLGNYKKTICTTRPKQTGERNTKDDVDLEFFSLDRYLELLCQGQTVALDMLFAPKGLYTYQDPYTVGIMEFIYKNRMEFLNKNVNAFVGYARQQAAKYGVKGFRVAALREVLDFLKWQNLYLTIGDFEKEWTDMTKINEHIKLVPCRGPNGTEIMHLEVCNRKVPYNAKIKYATELFQRLFDEYGQRALQAEKNEGIDWKALSHAVRVNGEAQELLETGFITFPRPNRELLLKIKTGQMDYSQVAEIIEAGLEGLKTSQSKSTLREAPDLDFKDNLVFEIYREIVEGKYV